MSTFVTRFRIEDEIGRVMTEDGFFSYDTDNAWEFRDEQSAHEECAWIIGASVERFQRYAEYPDFTGHNASARLERAFEEGRLAR